MSGLRQQSQERDEFASVFHPSAAASSSPAAAAVPPGASSVGRQLPQTQLSEQQLFDRIEEQLEQLDKKRLMLQQLVRGKACSSEFLARLHASTHRFHLPLISSSLAFAARLCFSS
jgi:hypothetical protein